MKWMIAILVATIAIIGGWLVYKTWERGVPESTGWHTANEEMRQLLQKQSEEKKPGSAETKGKSVEANKKPSANEAETGQAGKGAVGTPNSGNEPVAEALAAGSQPDALPVAASTNDGATIETDPSKSSKPDIPEKRKEKEKEESKGKIQLNKATAAQLITIPGIGESKAKAILAHRKQIGRFHSIEQLLDVKGIGEKLLEKMKPYLAPVES
jgi:competence protein ComEA